MKNENSNHTPCNSTKNIFFNVNFSSDIFFPFFSYCKSRIFSHDEWQKYDHMYTYGFLNFISNYGQLQAGPEFGYPVRPLGFIQQGFSSLFMMNDPWLSHSLEVLIHFFNVVAFYFLMKKLNFNSSLIITALLIFIVSPLTITSTAWSAASFDRIYPLFCILSVYFAVGIYSDSSAVSNYVGLFFFASCASLSKETAVMLPVLIFFGFLMKSLSTKTFLQVISSKEIYFVGLIVGTPFILYLSIRFPAILATLNGASNPAYSPENSNLIRNLILYWAFPYTPNALEMHSMSLLPKAYILLGFLIHLGILVSTWVSFGLKKSLLYVALYFIFLLPVLSITNVGGHYLYAASPIASIVIASLWQHSYRSKKILPFIFVVTIFVFSTYRFFQIQKSFYDDGFCQRAIITSIESQLKSTYLD